MRSITFGLALFVLFSVIYLVMSFKTEFACLQDLDKGGYEYERVGGYNTKNCTVYNPVKLIATPTTKLQSPVVLSCSFAKAVGDWTADIGAETITHVGGYNCRKIAGSNFMSEHSYGRAIDITKIDGVPIRLEWKSAASAACNYFNNILTPDTDAAHSDHLHLDNGLGLGCSVKNLISIFDYL